MAPSGDALTLRCGREYDDDKRAGQGATASVSQVNLNAAGIDVGASSHFVAVSADRAEPPVREFEAFTSDLYRLADWLTECGVEMSTPTKF